MIPQRVYLKGVLCYRGEQELHLTDSPIWMLSGPNGSGKSAVFDAVTKLRERLNEAQQNLRTFERDVLQHADTCRSIYEVELDTLSRNRVARKLPADWLSTTYPTQADLDEMHQKPLI